MALGRVSSEYFGFPCQFSFRQMLHAHLSPGAGRTGPLVTDVPSPTPPHEIKKNIHVKLWDEPERMRTEAVVT
jgi:hypothetical protein